MIFEMVFGARKRQAGQDETRHFGSMGNTKPCTYFDAIAFGFGRRVGVYRSNINYYFFVPIFPFSFFLFPRAELGMGP